MPESEGWTGRESRNGVPLFVPKLAFIVDSLTLRTYRISLTALPLFSCPPASNRCEVNENRTPVEIKSSFGFLGEYYTQFPVCQQGISITILQGAGSDAIEDIFWNPRGKAEATRSHVLPAISILLFQ